MIIYLKVYLEVPVGNEKVTRVLTWACFHTHQFNAGAILSPGGFTLTLFGQGTDPLISYKAEKSGAHQSRRECALACSPCWATHIVWFCVPEIPGSSREPVFLSLKSAHCFPISTAISRFLVTLFKMSKQMKPILCLRPHCTHHNIEGTFLKNMFVLILEGDLRERGRERDREIQTLMGCLGHAPPPGSSPQPGHLPCPGIKPVPSRFMGCHLTAEPYQLGKDAFFNHRSGNFDTSWREKGEEEIEKSPPPRACAVAPSAGPAAPQEGPASLSLPHGHSGRLTAQGWAWAGGVSSGFSPSLSDQSLSFCSFCLLLQSIVCTGRRQWHPDPALVHCIQSCEVSHLPFPKPRPDFSA